MIVESSKSFGYSSDEDPILLEEWNQLAQKKYELDVELDQVEDTIYDMYPDARIARNIQQDRHLFYEKMPLLKRVLLKRMRERSEKLIRTIDRQVFSRQHSIKFDLLNINIQLGAVKRKMNE
ncbi:hypothetical protein PRIPAC_96722 [Pristionchus pacificus]|uniref:Uncharacterized protein n=1 Tax=Pristionchus pacificus TaxID=54126 RepID=A0A2A6D338_PRIPA|nr:hypothetical protein PRIPAC_96722 [Pristionchus pacificus]|eukprot:PDM84780.1 hypothetical protein PRIPAC_33803 [Pristionchus pacificus]